MTVASVVDLATRRTVEQIDAPQEAAPWSLPPGAVPMDCVTFGQWIRTVERLTARVEKLEQRLRDAERMSAGRRGSE